MADDLRREREELTTATRAAVCGLSGARASELELVREHRGGSSPPSTEELIVYAYLA